MEGGTDVFIQINIESTTCCLQRTNKLKKLVFCSKYLPKERESAVCMRMCMRGWVCCF